MKRNIIKYVCLPVFLLAGCGDLLDEKQTSEWTDDDVWRIKEMAEGVLLNAYHAIPQLPDEGSIFLDAATDNALTINYSSAVYRLATAGATATNNPVGEWSTAYAQLQNVNLFLEKGLAETIVYDRMDQEKDSLIRRRLEGEAHFLRAWWSFRLLMQYGGKTASGEALGYPITLSFIPEDKAYTNDFVRATYEQCARQIMADCDKAIELLPPVYSNNAENTDPWDGSQLQGRGAGYTAGVLKSRVAIYAASPAYQPDAVTTIRGMGEFTVTDAATYEQKWAEAALIANQVLEMDGFGTFVALQANHISDAGNTTPADFVLRKFFNNKSLETRYFPPAYQGNAYVTPSHNFVQSFPALNGFPADDPRADIDPADPYVSRDKRLDLNVYYHGRRFGNNGQPIDVTDGGRDGNRFHPNATRTGYYLAKFISKKDNMLTVEGFANAIHYNPILRKAEVFLNYAEAANEAWGPHGKDPSCIYTAYEVMEMVRRLSGGITDVTYLDEMAADKDSFRKLIQNERRLETAFENQRFYDMRRWLLPLGETILGVEVTVADGVPTFTLRDAERRNFTDVRYYYFPIPYDEIVKNPGLVNNLGWN